MPTDYHEEWRRLYGGKAVDVIHEEVVRPVLEQNDLYMKRKHKEGNSGVIDQVNEFERYLEDHVQPPRRNTTLYAETGYLLWLFGIRLENEYSETLHHRIKSFLRGATYPDGEHAGFKQAEYELHCIARFVEEGIEFKDNELEGQEETPDLTLDPGGVDVFCEVKAPTSGSDSAISKALSQIGDEGGGMILSFDFIMASSDYSMEAFHDAFENVRDVVSGERAFAFVEFLDPSDAEEGSYITTAKGDGYSREAYDLVYQAMVRQ